MKKPATMSEVLVAVWACLMGVAASAGGAQLDLDPAYGEQGRMVFNTGQDPALYVYVGRSILQPDGKLIVTGARTVYDGRIGRSPNELFVRRFNADGSPDTGFGAAGEARFSVRGSDAINMIAIQTDGKILLAVGASEPCVAVGVYCDGALTSAIVRLTTDGKLDMALGGKGYVEATDFYGGYALAVQSDGKLLLLGTNSISRARILDWRLARFNSDGTRDLTFNNGQTVRSRCEAYGYAVIVQPDGGIVVGGNDDAFYGDSSANPGFCIERLFADGSHDAGFNQGQLRTNFGVNVGLASLTLLTDGHLLAVGRGIRVSGNTYESGVLAARYAVDGTLDPGYGNAGKWFVPLADSYAYTDFTFSRDGGLIAAGYEYPSPPFGQAQRFAQGRCAGPG